RLGISSPKITEPAVIRTTAVPMPIGRTYSLAAGQVLSSQSAICRPMASAPSRPVRMPMAVMPICTVDSRLSGCSASARAWRAPRLSSDICFRRSLREVISAISDSAKNPFSAIRATTTSSSSMPLACGSCGVGIVHAKRPDHSKARLTVPGPVGRLPFSRHNCRPSGLAPSQGHPSMFSLQTMFGQGKQFYTLLEDAAVAGHDASQALYEMLQADDRVPALDAFRLARQREREASEQISQELVDAFITPIEREDIEA